MELVQYSVPNISCGHCVHTIQMELSEIDGVRSVVANEAEKTVRVEYEPPANPQAIETVLADINYPVAV